MNLRSVDLNLLTLFDALLEEQQLSRAADKLGMSQSAASNALSRLRLTFKDELFVRTRQGMEPTPKALQLAQPVREGLASIRRALTEESAFDPATSEREFRLILNDFIEPLLLPPLLMTMQEQGPKLSIHSFSNQRKEHLDLLRKAQMDFYFDMNPADDPAMESVKIYEETLSVVARKEHPRLHQPLTIDDYLNEQHVVFTHHDGHTTTLDLALQKHYPLPRKVLAQASHISLVPELILQSDALATMPTQTAQRFCRNYPLQSFEFPLDIGALPLYMIWHKALNNDQAPQWLKQNILKGIATRSAHTSE